MDVRPRLPDFIVAGARRCGTTWLHRCLSEHPGIALPQGRKEVFFFDRHWDKGVDWYSRQFRHSPPNAVAGEVSPSYFYAPEVPQRVHNVVPGVKLVFIFRNPLDRLYSLYHHLRGAGDVRGDFATALDNYPELLREGFYAELLNKFQAEFPPGNIMMLPMEDVVRGTEDRLSPLFRFLRVNADFRPPSLDQVINRRKAARSDMLGHATARLSRALHHSGLHGVVRLAKRAGAETLAVRRVENDTGQIAPALRAKIHGIYDADVDRLSRVTGRDLAQLWRY